MCDLLLSYFVDKKFLEVRDNTHDVEINDRAVSRVAEFLNTYEDNDVQLNSVNDDDMEMFVEMLDTANQRNKAREALKDLRRKKLNDQAEANN